jgi:membrane-bound metal-dependent hydrolase YbcI (DUF457 family)
MSTLFEGPVYRYAVGAVGAAMIAGVALLGPFEGTSRTVLFAVAAIDFVVTPQLLGMVAEDA